MLKRIPRIIKKMWNYLLVQVLKVEIKQTGNFNGIKLTVNKLEKGGVSYFQKDSYREVINPFWPLLQKIYNPDVVLDIGANYGFTANVSASIFKNAQVIAIEPSSTLCKYIEINKQNNNNDNLTVLRAICDDSAGKNKGFSINPLYSQDNRVKGDSALWKTEQCVTTSIDSLLGEKKDLNFAYIKIDTQGFEKSVFNGAKEFLNNNSNWIVKTEFCPYCLVKQDTDPKELLTYLVENYDVIDFQGEIAYNENSIIDLFKNKIKPKQVSDIVDHIIKLDHTGLGWTDLLLKSKELE